MKMTLIFSVFCVFLFTWNGVEGQIREKVLKEDEAATITISDREPPGSILFWIRLRENGQGFEHIGAYSKRSPKVEDEERFELTEKGLKVKHFDRLKDSGTYSCVSINNNKLQFDCVTKLRGEQVPTTSKPKETPRIQTEAMTTKATVNCRHNFIGKLNERIDVRLGCELHILIPLAAGSGLLLLILIFTILYCNRIRTRRCPHHYKRQPRSRTAGHKTLPNPPDY
ncbi:T-cell surface glycoprotein CD8 alpha chain isoform X1 [Silurus meridionalis]|uniref:T-cell surface glycoprotein CD8 alpha chain isoform X1 n=1 Tax=Silurus meridionalis TaxID=175797 RepID=UPI001EEC151C|nr:T-cell surface glycoprotein CD8 alpha chain isoform X1 [Silurus meridionalis]